MNRNIPTVTILFIFFLAAWFISITNAGSAPTGLIATPNQFTLSNTIIDVGQSSFANTLITGGAGAPYAGQWVFLSSNQVINQVINTITVASYPRSVAFNPAGTLAYVTNEGSDTVSIINTVTNTVINTITVGTYPTDVVVSPSGTLVYVTNQYVTASGAGNVSVINSATNTVINTITVGTKPIGVAFNPSGSLAYITNEDSGTVSVINVATNTVINLIAVGSIPSSVAFNPSGTLAYVTNYGTTTISVINVATNTVINTITAGNSPFSVAFNPSGTLAYVTNQGSNTASVINVATNTVINTIPTGNTPFSVAFNPSGTLAYVTNSNSGTTSVINVATNSVINTVTTNTGPISVAFNPSGTLAYIVNENTENVSVIGNLPETSIQELPQTSNTLSLTINAQNSNTLYLTFNGVAYTESTGSNSIYGTWSVYGFAQDNGTKIYYYGSNTLLLSNSLTINPALTVGSVTPASLTIDSGQSIILTGSWSGGTPDYTVKWYTGPRGSTCSQDSANILTTYSGLSLTSNSISVSPTTTNSYCIGVTDSASTSVTQLSSNDVVTVNPALSVPTISPSNPAIDSGQSTTFTSSWSGGSPTYGASLYSSTTPTCNQQSTLVQQVTGLTSGSVTFSSVSPASTTYYCVLVTDNSTNAYSISTTLVFGNLLYGVAFAPSGTYAYVANCNDGNNELNGQSVCVGNIADNVTIMSTATNTVVGSITPGFNGPVDIAFSPSGTYAYVANAGSNSIAIVNTATNTVTSTITSGFNQPSGVSFSPSGTYAYVTNQNTNNVVIINTATNSVSGSITSGFSTPIGLSFSPSGTYAYVTNFHTYNVVIINTATNTVTNSVTTSINSGFTNPTGVSFSPSGTYAYVSNFWANITIINTATNSTVGTILSPFDNRGGIAISPSGAYAYLTDIYSDKVVIINTGVPTTNSLNSKVTVNPALSVPTITPSTPSIDTGQSITLTGSWSGGTPDYTVKWYTGPSGSTCSEDSANVLATHSGLSLTSNSISVSPTTTNSYCIGVTDSASATVTRLSANDIVNVNNALTVGAILPSSPILNSGQSITLNANAIGGTSPYTYDWYTIAGTASPTCTAANQITGQNSNTLQATPTATSTYAYQVTDSAPIHSVACSSGDTVTVKLGTQVSNPYAGSSTGFFGNLPGTTPPVATSSTTTTISTTSANTTAPATIPVIKQSTGVTTQLCNDTAGYYIVYTSINATIHILPGISSCINVTAKNETSKYIQSNRSIITAINYSTNNTNVSSIAIIHYSCSIPYSDVYPSIFRNNTWQEINPFTLNVSACSVSFAIPPDPVIALINSAHANSTTVKTTTSANTTLPQTTAYTSNTNQQNQNLLTGIFAIIVIIAVAIIAYYILKNKHI